MNRALKIFSIMALITLAVSFPQNSDNHDQLTRLARLSQQSTQIGPATLPAAGVEEGPTRSKRAIIFRPLFVYRQQQITKQRLKEERAKKAQTAAQVPAGSNYAPNYYYKRNCNC